MKSKHLKRLLAVFIMVLLLLTIGAYVVERQFPEASADDFSEAITYDFSDNIDAIRKSGHPVPSLDSWWVKTPKPDEVTAALAPPLINNGQICIRRLWIPRKLTVGNVDGRLFEQMSKSPKGPHRLALLAHYAEAQQKPDQAQKWMKAARDEFWIDPWVSYIYCYSRADKVMAATFALDWIRWSDKAEFERAFARTLAMVETSKESSVQNGREFRKDGYWNATHPWNSAYFLEELLALSVHGVNVDGKSHTWAVARLKQLGADFKKDTDPLYSTFEFANVLSLLSRRGGGREFGQEEKGPGLGGYETGFSIGGILQLRAVDTATGGKFKLVEKSLYCRTRQLGLLLEEDRTVSKSTFGNNAKAAIRIFAKWYASDPEVGGLYQWLLRDTEMPPNLLEFQALAGPEPTPVAPGTTPIAERTGSRWHYRENPSKPDSTFRMWLTNRDVENFRVAPDERCLSFAIGNIGLVDGHANRAYCLGALSNGVHLSKRLPDGEPYIGDRSYWPLLASHHPYWTSRQAKTAGEVLLDPYFLVGANGPTENNGDWTWTRDYTSLMTRQLKSGVVDKISLAKAEYHIQPAKRRLEIVDTIRADSSVYVGWHFSPTHKVKVLPDGFEFSDGKNRIVVMIKELSGVTLKLTKRQEWKQGDFTIPLDWHEMVGGPKRIAENLGYTPVEPRQEYKVRVVIQAY